jgi:hypothetical protein
MTTIDTDLLVTIAPPEPALGETQPLVLPAPAPAPAPPATVELHTRDRALLYLATGSSVLALVLAVALVAALGARPSEPVSAATKAIIAVAPAATPTPPLVAPQPAEQPMAAAQEPEPAPAEIAPVVAVEPPPEIAAEIAAELAPVAPQPTAQPTANVDGMVVIDDSPGRYEAIQATAIGATATPQGAGWSSGSIGGGSWGP